MMETTIHPTDVLRHGRKLIADMHREYVALVDEGCDEDDAFWKAYDVGSDNLDALAIIWAAGAVTEALQCEEVREAIEQAICFG